MKLKYVKKCCEAVSKGLQYTIMLTWGYAILKETDWLPWTLFGKGTFDSFEFLVKDNPWTFAPEGV